MSRDTSIEIPFAVESSNCNENKFRNIVYEFIERIAKEVSFYDNDSELNISASVFRHIESQIQAQRIKKVLQLCISKIRLVFFVSQLIEYQRDHLKLLFQPPDVECIENFAQKWIEMDFDHDSNGDFNADLNHCLDAADRTDNKIKIQSVSLVQ